MSNEPEPEKLGPPASDEYFAERWRRADFSAFDRLMNRNRGEKPREGDER